MGGKKACACKTNFTYFLFFGGGGGGGGFLALFADEIGVRNAYIFVDRNDAHACEYDLITV